MTQKTYERPRQLGGGWVERFDSVKQRVYWESCTTGAIVWHNPTFVGIRRMLKRRNSIQGHTGDATQMDYMNMFTATRSELMREKIMNKAVTMMQKIFRGQRARRALERAVKQNAAALHIQRMYRGHRVRSEFRVRIRATRAARRIQFAWRGYRARAWAGLTQAGLAMRKAENVAARKLTAVGRGFLARKRLRAEKWKKVGPSSSTQWVGLKAGGTLKRTWEPKREWEEWLAPAAKCAVADTLCIPFGCVHSMCGALTLRCVLRSRRSDVRFYYNNVTRNYQWEQPEKWAAQDSKRVRQEAEMRKQVCLPAAARVACLPSRDGTRRGTRPRCTTPPCGCSRGFVAPARGSCSSRTRRPSELCRCACLGMGGGGARESRGCSECACSECSEWAGGRTNVPGRPEVDPEPLQLHAAAAHDRPRHRQGPNDIHSDDGVRRRRSRMGIFICPIGRALSATAGGPSLSVRGAQVHDFPRPRQRLRVVCLRAVYGDHYGGGLGHY